MSVAANQDVVTVALLGNPNTGKSTLFNALSGVRQRVGNYPGVTVEKKIGRVDIHGRSFSLVDLPGTYSLAPRSPDEMVAVDVLLGRQADVPPPDVVVCIVDASNLERNLYLVSQILELGRPTVIALNMIDVAADKGVEIDVPRLRERLGIPVVELRANRRIGIDALKDTLASAIEKSAKPPISPFPDPFRNEVGVLESLIRERNGELPRYLVERLLLDTSGYLQAAGLPGVDDEVLAEVRGARSRLADAGLPVPAVEAMARYEWVGRMLDGTVKRPSEHKLTTSDRIDRILTHKLWGTFVFVAVMVVIFQSIFNWAAPAMDAIESGIGWLGELAGGLLPAGALQSLIVDGVIGGVGAVLVFLPQIFILFFFIALLEDCGYMARAAYLMDKLMSCVGLSGKSFIPLLSSFACAIPGIMAARVIENRRDRLVTMLVAPLMSCSARLPVYTIMIAAFIPNQKYAGGWLGLQGITMFAMYTVGILVAVMMAFLLKKTLLQGETPAFVMELSSYKLPSIETVFVRMTERGWSFVRRAGTLIFAVTILVWAAAYFPRDPSIETQVKADHQKQIAALEQTVETLDSDGAEHPQYLQAKQELDDLNAGIEHRIAGVQMRQSILGRMGQLIEPVVRPLGWDWRIGCAVVASFPAREVVIGTMGVIYNLGAEEDEASKPLREKLQTATWDGTGRPVFNIPVALSIMVFFALCAQCASTLVVMRRETASWRWPVFTFVYMTVLAYLGALVTYQVGMLLT